MKAEQVLFSLVSHLAQALLLAAVLASFYQVVARFLLAAPADWSEVLTRALLIWVVMLGMALACRQGTMMAINLLRDRLTGRRRRALEWFLALVSGGFLLSIALLGGQLAWRMRFQTLPSLEVSIAWVYLAIPVGALLATIALFSRIATPGIEPQVLADRGTAAND